MSLINQVSVKQVAFGWSSIIRVFKVPQITVGVEVERFRWQTLSGTRARVTNGFWLKFAVSSEHFIEQILPVSPDSGFNTNTIDIFNQLEAGALDFYPLYDTTPALKYAVQGAHDNITLFQTQKNRFKKQATIQMEAVTRVATLPSEFNFK